MTPEELFEKWKESGEFEYMSKEADQTAREAFLAGYKAAKGEEP